MTPSAIASTEGVPRIMSLSKLKTAAATVMAVALFTSTAPPGRRAMGLPQAPEAAVKQPSRARVDPETRSPLRRAFDQAFLVARSTEDPAERAEQLLRLGMAQTRQGQRDEARATLSEARLAAAAIKPNANYASPHPIIRIARAQAEAGDPAAAHRTFQEAVRAIAAESDAKQGQNWFNMVVIQIETEPRAAMAETFKACRRFIENEEPRGAPGQIGALIWLDAALSGNPEGALRKITAPELGASSPHPQRGRCDALLAVVRCFGPDERERMRPVLAEAHEVIDAMRGPDRFLRPYLLHGLANQEARLGFFAEAIATADAIVPGDADRPNEPKESSGRFQKALAFVEIAQRMSRAGDLQGAAWPARRAFEVAEAIKDEPHRASPLSRATEPLIRFGDLKNARQAIDSIRQPHDAIACLRQLARVESRRGNQATARTLWIRALNSVRENRQPAGTLAEIQAEMGNVAGALRTVATIAAEDDKHDALCRVALALASMGDVRGAISVVEGMTSTAVKNRAWIGIACGSPAP